MKKIDSENRLNLKAGFWYTISNFLSKALIYLCTPIYLRIISAEVYGIFNNYLSWQSILMVIIALELSSSIAIAYLDYKEKFDEYVTTIMICGVGIPFIFSVIIMLFNPFFCRLFNVNLTQLCIMLLTICTSNSINIYQSSKRVKLEYKSCCVVTILTAVLNVTLSLSMVYTMENKLLALILGACVGNIFISFAIFSKTLIKKFTFKWKYALYGLHISLPLIPHVLASVILGSSDKIMITSICGSESTALYSVVYNISLIITMLVTSINNAWVPWFFQKLKNNEIRPIKLISNILTIGMLIPMVAIVLTAPEIIYIVGGDSYVKAASCVPCIVLNCFGHFLLNIYVNIEFYTKKTIYISIGTIFASIINIILNFVLLPYFGYKAAAYTTLISTMFMVILHLFIIKKMKMLNVFDNKFLLGTSLMALVIIFNLQKIYDIFELRISIIALFFTAIVVLAYKYRSSLKSVLASIFKK